MTDHDDIERACLEIAGRLQPLNLASGTVFVRQGDESDAAYLLTAGTVTVFSETSYGKVPLATLTAPRLIGEVGALASLPRTASLAAETGVTLYRIDRALLIELASSRPSVLLSVIGHLGEQLTSINKTLALFDNALRALEAQDFDAAIMEDLRNPPAELADFASTFRRFAFEITTKRKTEQEMASAALIQRSLLPPASLLAALETRLSVFATMKPARSVGGDFYDYFMIDERRFAFAVGDICGKGIPASLFASMVVTVLRTEVREAASLASAMARANSIICRDNAASLFATVFVGVLDIETGDLVYANCGHNAPLVVSSSGHTRSLSRTGIPLGLFEDRSASEAHARLGFDDRLIVFTDGVTEANDRSGGEFGDDRLLEIAMSTRASTPHDIGSAVLAAVDGFAADADQSDDITLLILSRLPVG